MKRILAFFILASVMGAALAFPVKADTASEIADKNAQIQALQQQIAQYQQQIDAVHGQALTLQGQVNSLTAQINQITLELRSLALSISNTNAEITQTQGKITVAEGKIAKDQSSLGQYLRLVYQNDQESLPSILIKNNTLSDFFNELNSVQTIQDDLKTTIDNILGLKNSLEQQKQDLEDKKTDLQQQQQLVTLAKRDLDSAKAQKAKILADTKGQESKLQQAVTKGKQNIAAIQQEIYYLQQNGVSVDDAIKYGNLAAISVGIRPAFLLAELEVESGLGENVGKCNRAGDPPSKSYRVVMHPTRDIPVFLNIMSQLGMDPETSPVSCKPSYGWGGAMGPAQFIPSTWVGYAARVAQIVGESIANPYHINDAFTAAGIKLANAGATAKTTAAEIAASKAYFSGNSKCSTAACNSYANAVQRTAAELEQSL